MSLQDSLANIKSSNVDSQVAGLSYLAKNLVDIKSDVDKVEATVAEVMAADVLPLLLSYAKSSNEAVQYQALSVLGSLAVYLDVMKYSLKQHHNTFFQGDGVATIVEALKSPHPACREKACVLIGNIAQGNYRDLLLKQGAIPLLLGLLEKGHNKPTIIALAECCVARGGNPPPPLEKINSTLGTWMKLVYDDDDEIVAWALCSLDALSRIGSHPALADPAIIARFVTLLGSDKPTILDPLAGTLLNLYCEDEKQIKVLTDAKVLKHLVPLLSRPLVQQVTCAVYSNAVGSEKPGQIQALIESGAVEHLKNLLISGPQKIQREVAWVFVNAFSNSNAEQIQQFSSLDVIVPLYNFVKKSLDTKYNKEAIQTLFDLEKKAPALIHPIIEDMKHDPKTYGVVKEAVEAAERKKKLGL